MSSPDWLEAAARRSSLEPWTLGHTFERYRDLESRTPKQLADELGCTEEQVKWMALCHCPQDEGFAEQVAQLAKRYEVDLRQLTRILRRVQVMEALRRAKAGGKGTRKVTVLIAARDHSTKDKKNS
ncbi:hypothetical protein MYSTI_04991 [Myxococcus stipitatus DSM 14675]|uniref:Uncharacterized protein n=1 Tax=Myxococcus stipitatus (strain DSM 14675 / JCM 12634 / Mx s8) TaxID=1278073 RepID=L7UIJ2_MYXSD|nr:hypothetical protein [Myxococcus stipitatus]AGC46279.1 hypothetical protein MYSTI_04991 [Myxococcus stipitatus DSM 14675]